MLIQNYIRQSLHVGERFVNLLNTDRSGILLLDLASIVIPRSEFYILASHGSGSLETHSLQVFLYKLSSYVAGKTLGLVYKDQELSCLRKE
jgi:hypothetical protein